MSEKALSVRQPWAWAIMNAGKDIENRSWQAVNHGLKRRGRIAIHAAVGMTRRDYDDAADFINRVYGRCPRPEILIRGAIIGFVDVVDVVSESDSPWFFGPRGLVLENPQPVYPSGLVKGALGYFDWEDTGKPLPEAKPWMISWPGEVQRSSAIQAGLPLFQEEKSSDD